MKLWLEVRGPLIWSGVLVISAGVGLWTNNLAKTAQMPDVSRIELAFFAGVVALIILIFVHAIVRAGSPDSQDQL